MIVIKETSTISDALHAATDRYGDHSLLAVPHNPARDYYPDGREISYSEAGKLVQELSGQYLDAGYGFPHRVGLFLASRPEHMLHKLALNMIGVCCVPINPDYRTAEIVYLIEHARLDLIVVLDIRLAEIEQALAKSQHRPAVVTLEQFGNSLPDASTPRTGITPQADTPASILYTSGTTGRPKGCVLSHRYELAAGDWYARQGGLISIQPRKERLYSPLPLFHVNASILSFYCMLLTGNCQVQTDRFQPSRGGR